MTLISRLHVLLGQRSIQDICPDAEISRIVLQRTAGVSVLDILPGRVLQQMRIG